MIICPDTTYPRFTLRLVQKRGKAMRRGPKKTIKAYGVRALLSPHPEIRKLKQMNSPSAHGNKVWKSTWLLIDYLNRKGLPDGARVIEVGCGWGLAAIYCAKQHGAEVTAIDGDAKILPYLRLHAEINEVEITALKKDFTRLRVQDFEQVDVLIGADICFWDTLVDPLRKLILRALRAGVQQVLITDPGRSPFEQLGNYFINKRNGRVFYWTAQRPRRSQGRILKIVQEGGVL